MKPPEQHLLVVNFVLLLPSYLGALSTPLAHKEPNVKFIRESWDILDLGAISISGKKQNITIVCTSTNKQVPILYLFKSTNQMLIAGLQPTTLVDYPDKLATIVFTPGCNLRCRFCHNPELVLLKNIEFIPEENFFAFLDARVGLLDGVVISGGEPTLQRDLIVFCKKIKEKGFLLKLDTNGRDPILVQRLIDENLLDYIAMDIKIDEAQRMDLLQTKEQQAAYLATIQLLLHAPISYEFRTTLIKPYHTLETFEKMVSAIQGAKQYYLQTYRPDVTLDPWFKGQAFTDDEMKLFQHHALKYVRSCFIR